jgi:multidrug efflux pump subunit AcrB
MKKLSEYITVFFFYRLAGFILLLSGLIFYLYWGIAFSGWKDSGLISFVAPLILLGLLTLWLAKEKEKESRKLAKK